MESTIILKTDALNALVAAHRLMKEMSNGVESADSVQFERGFSAAISTIATVFGLDPDAIAPTTSPKGGWNVRNEHDLSLSDGRFEAIDWPTSPASNKSLARPDRR